jgi:hypothetical protein
MIKHYFLPLLQGACFMLLSLFLQSCGGLGNLPLEGEEELTTIEREEQGRRKRARIEVREEEQLVLMEQGQKVGSFDIFPPEIWQEIFTYLDFEGVLMARAVNSDWNQLITDSRQTGIVGVKNRPQHIIDTRGWVKREEINFIDNKLKGLTLATIPSFAFYYLMGHVENLRKELWPYLKGTNVHTLYLGQNNIGDAGAIELAKALPETQMHTLDLSNNKIEATGASELARALLSTQVYTLNLGGNELGNAGAIELAKALPGTQVHTLDLGHNRIGDAGAIELAKALPNTQVHTLDLGWNQIGDAGVIELAKALPNTQVHTLDLNRNKIGDAGVIELAKSLPNTQVHTPNLRYNQIGEATKQLLIKQYPHIKWWF